MASIASVDKTLSRVSSWMSSAAFAGLLSLAFLPVRDAPAPVKIAAPLPAVPAAVPAARQPHSVADTALATPPAAPAPPAFAAPASPAPAVAAKPSVPPASATAPVGTTAPAVAAATPPAITTPPPPDVWTPEELAAGLRQCVQLLSPVSADVAMEEPMKHGQCGTPAPLALRSAGGKDKVEFTPAPTMNCRLAASMGAWVDKVLQPAAQETLGSRITKILGSGSYSCRNIYNNPKLTLSEHATGNAIDVAAFVTADGRTITVKHGWGPTERDIVAAKKKAAEKLAAKKSGKPAAATPEAVPTPSIAEAAKKAETKQKGRVEKTDFKQDGDKPAVVAISDLQPATSKEAVFLKRLHGGSCTLFATVLGPEANEAHRDHFHLDMKVRRTSHGVCH
ncbi:MAG: extensin family protein [Hyphomicrobium sp.]